MLKQTLSVIVTLLAGAGCMSAAESKLTMTTQAPAGTELRIFAQPYNSATVEGAESGRFYGTYISNGPGSQITLTGDIDQLEIYGCQLSDLNIESAPDMYILKCYDNQLETLSLGNCPELAVLDCHGNKLTSLDVSAGSSLEELNASDNALTAVTFGSQPEMRVLNLAGNKLTALDITGVSTIEDLYVQHNLLVNLDLSACTKLYWVFAFCNQLAGPNMDNFIANLPVGAQSPSMLYIVDTFAEEGEEGNVCLVKDVNAAREKGWVSMDYANGANNGSMTGQFYRGADYVPAVSENGVRLTTSRTPGQTITVKVKSSGNFTVSGVAETNFISGSNTLTLTSQEVIINGDLTTFECPGNDITALEFLGTASLLTSFDCSNNAIESLNIVNAGALTQIHAQNNALTSLNIEGCDAIMRVDCYSNALHGTAMQNFMESLPDGTKNEPYLFVIDTADSEELNVATTADVAIATGKKWVVYDYVGGDRYGMGQIYAGSEPAAPVTPDEYFTFTSTTAEVMLNVTYADPAYYPVADGAEILGWNGSALTLRVTPSQPATIYGDMTSCSAVFTSIVEFDASACPNLVELNLMVNEIGALDLSKNTRLQTLQVFGNELESLNIAGCNDLTLINCYGNKLAGEAMTSLIEALPQRSATNPGQLVVYDSNYDREHNVCTVADVNAAKAKCWIAYELDEQMNPVEYAGYTESSISEISSPALPAAEYFNLSGVKVANPARGIYLRRQGSDVTKVIIK